MKTTIDRACQCDGDNMKTTIGFVVCLAVVLVPRVVFGQAMDELIAKLDAVSNDCPNAWVNEFHYDNAGIDTNEFIEVVFGPDSGVSNLNEYQCWIYDQYGGAVSNIGLDEFTLGGSSNGFTFYTYMMPLDDFQIGIGISIDTPTPIFISYEGIVEATNGPYGGLLSEDVGVYEDDSTPEGSSIALEGEGASYRDFDGAWTPHSFPLFGFGATPGMPNPGQVLVHPTNAFAELTLIKDAPAGPVQAGSNITYTITVTNAGPYAATAVHVVDLLPSGALFGSASASQGSCTLDGNTLTCSLGTVAKGNCATVTVSVTPTVSGVYTNVAGVISAARPESDPIDNLGIAVTSVTSPMDELIAELDAISNDCPNAWVNEFHYDNAGIDVEEFIEICFGPDSGPSNIEEYACWIYDQYGGAISSIGLEEFTLGDSSNGFTFYTYLMPLDDYCRGISIDTPSSISIDIFISYEGIVEATNGPYEGLISEDVGVYESNYTPEGSSIALEGEGASYRDFADDSWTSHSNPGGGLGATPGMPNHNQTFVHPTNALAELKLMKDAPAGPIEAGSNITYTITVTNAGPYAATAVSVLDILPFGVLFGSANTSQGTCTLDGNTLTCFLGTVAKGNCATVTVSVTPAISGVFTNMAGVKSAARPDSNILNSLGMAVTTVTEATDTDGDGMPDWWEKLYQTAGLDPAVSNAPTSNMDTDSAPDIAEWTALTDPGDGTDYFHVNIQTADGGNPVVFFDSSAARLYRIDSRSNLTAGVWGNVISNLVGTGGMIEWPVSMPSDCSFWRGGVRKP